MTTAMKLTTIKAFHVCEIERLLDEPGRNWDKGRFDAQGAGGSQFEVWKDELPLLEKDINQNFSDIFSDMSHIIELPLAPFEQGAKAKPAMPKHPFKPKRPQFVTN